MAVPIDLAGTSAIVFGVANHRSIAWAIAQQFHAAGARLTVTYQNERLGRTVLELVKEMDYTQAVECDVLDEVSVASAIDAAAGTAPLTTEPSGDFGRWWPGQSSSPCSSRSN